jgi:4-amino-4-deoxy-L-arabinose transferase-like glycosyltransferase
MFRRLDRPAGHYLALVAAWAALCLPNLGAPGLWDIDEGNNSQCAREMLDSGNWVVPTFNYEWRYDKPALLYWLQATAYRVFGVNEFAARLPSALAALAAVLGAYELGRRMFGPTAALLAALVLASSPLFGAAAHFANPDALLCACTLGALAVFWCDHQAGRRRWFFTSAVLTGLAVLAKGPVGLVLPSAVTLLYLAWQRRLRTLLDVRLVGGGAVFLLTAVPWYVWVALETKGKWLFEFWGRHNQGRFLAPMENHQGPVVYYLLVLVIGLAPWSVFAGPLVWDLLRGREGDEGEGSVGRISNPSCPRTDWKSVLQGTTARERSALRFLLCWVAVYLVFFSLARTKLPNYVLPLYPAAALLAGRFLERWRRGTAAVPDWLPRLSLACLALVGVGLAAGLLVAGGAVPLAALRGRYVPGLQGGVVLGVLLVAAAAVALPLAWRGRRGAALAVCTLAALVLAGGAALWGAVVVDRLKAPRPLAAALPADHLRREVRVGAHGYFQPSLVFYCQRKVRRLDDPADAAEFLCGPLPSYLFVPARTWERMSPDLPTCRVLARHYDLYDHHDIVLVTNEAER